MHDASLAVAFATIERPHAAQRLVKSLRERFPDLPVYVADQSRRVEAMTTFYDDMRVHLIKMPYDAGVCASRNRLVQRIEQKYFVLCDDDFLFGSETDFSDAVQVLECHPEIGVVGGKLTDLDGSTAYARRWELYLAYDPANRILTSIPIDHFAPVVREIGSIRFYLCDAVLNFCVFRKSIFSDEVRWDERFKSNGEHEDFFLNLKMRSSHRVAYLPTMAAYHHHPQEYELYRSRLRDRNHGWREFMRKWQIDQHLELGLGVRTTRNVDEVVGRDDAQFRFFLNSDLSLRRSEIRPDILELSNCDRISATGALDTQGRALPEGPRFSRLLVQKGGRRVLAAPDPEYQYTADEPAAIDYALEPPVERTQPASFPGQTFFRYDPVLRDDSDFVVWYRGDHSAPASSKHGMHVILRWFDRHGTALVWETERRLLHGLSDRYWKPLFVEAPPFSRDWLPLRFEILEDRGSNKIPVCTGFLTADAGSDRSGGWDVLALCHSRNFVDPSGGTISFDQFIQGASSDSTGAVQVVQSVGGLWLLKLDPAIKARKLFLAGWNSLGKSFVRAELAGLESRGPELLALPRPGPGDGDARVFVYDPGRGLFSIDGCRGE